MVTLEEAKAYLRVDSDYEDILIASIITSAEALCADVARLSADEWIALSEYTGETGLTLRFEEKSHSDVLQIKNVLHIGILYALGYLYEHREEADHHDLVLMLRNLLFSVREGML